MTARAALAALALAGASGCCQCAFSPTFTVRKGAALAPGPAAPPPAGPVVRALHAGDLGDTTCQQEAVAGAIVAAHRRAPFAVALFAGDNIYDCGPDHRLPGAGACAFAPDGNTVAPGFSPPDDPSFDRHEAALAPLAAPPAPRAFLALGNHDVATCGAPDPDGTIARLKACLEVAHASPVWSMPGRHYVVDEGPARFIVIDSNFLRVDAYGGFSFEDEVAFVREASAGCGDRACFLVAHHPAAMAGEHRDDAADPRYRERTAALLAAAGGRIRAWLCGHDHELQHVRTADGLDVLVSGNGARMRGAEKFLDVSGPGVTLLFGSVRWGFGVLEVGADGWRYRFEGDDGGPLYCCAAAGAGRCEPVACR